MADQGESTLDKAEGLARRILDRLGAKLDSRLSGKNALGANQISDLTTRIERAIESNLREAETGPAKIAPNRFRVLLTYEETSSLTTEYMEAVSKELTNTVHEYINNRRYGTRGPIVVEVTRDVFAKSTLVKADCSTDVSGKDQSSETKETGATNGTGATPQSSPGPEATTTVILRDDKGNEYRIALASNGSPACIGRAAGNTIRIDDSSISRVHCSLAIRRSGEVVVADLGSANGTFVNNGRLGADEARKLTPGDVVRLGDLALTVSGLLDASLDAT